MGPDGEEHGLEKVRSLIEHKRLGDLVHSPSACVCSSDEPETQQLAESDRVVGMCGVLVGHEHRDPTDAGGQ